ncbi:MAG: Rieske 2Fe-2S domain-containing protein [Thermoplasmata archaeon]
MNDAHAACPSDCPFLNPAPRTIDFPVGHVRRVAMARNDDEVDETKRNVLKLLAIAGVLGAAGGGLIGGAAQYLQPPMVGLSSYPVTQLIDVDGSPLTVSAVEKEYSVTTNSVITFNYPLQNEPNFLINLKGATNEQGEPIRNIPGGIGTEGTILAYSAICQHLGCTAPAISYYPPGTCSKTFQSPYGEINFYIHCSCHGSTYDVTNGAANLTGPAVLPLPQVVLTADPHTGIISAVGMTPSSPPVNGHVDTLKGDYGVGSSSPLVKQGPGPILCSFPS